MNGIRKPTFHAAKWIRMKPRCSSGRRCWNRSTDTGAWMSMPTWRVSFEYDFIFRAKYRTVYCDPNFTSEADSFY